MCPTTFIRRIDNRCSLIKRVEIIPVTIKVRNIVAGSLAKRIGYPDGTRLKNTVVEYCLKDPELEDPLVNLTHITAMEIATAEEMHRMEEMSLRVNDILSECMREINIELIDFKLEFGRFHGEILLGGRGGRPIRAVSGMRVPMSRWISIVSVMTWATWRKPTARCCTA